MKPLVSILIPAHNAQTWIADTIRSALAQTWENKEIIVIVDGSTDRTPEIVDRFTSQGVIVHRQERSGAPTARNVAFGLSRGDYIQWLDADDLLSPNKIERQLGALTEHDTRRTLLSCPWGKFFYRVEAARFTPCPLWYDLSPKEWLLRRMESGSHMQTATWLVSRELTELAGPWDARLVVDDDGEYFCRVKRMADGIRFVPAARVYYRHHTEQRVSVVGTSRAKQEALLLSSQLCVGYMLSLEDSDRSRAACLAFLQKRMLDFHPNSVDLVAQMQESAAALGGRLEFPRSPRRYIWIQDHLGWGTASLTRRCWRTVKIAAMQWFDRALYQLGEMVRNETDSGKLADGGQHTRMGPELGNQLGAAIPTSVSQTSTSLSKNSSSIE
jgi:glycosyltransferase involved in cell wall biosynthesis